MFPCPRPRLKNWSCETGSTVLSRVSPVTLHTQAEPGDDSRENAFHDGVHLSIPSTVIGSVPIRVNRVTYCVSMAFTYQFSLVPSPSLLNLERPFVVLGYECGRVFPAGIALDLPSRDNTDCLSTRFGRSVETRRRFGWLRMVPTRCASSELAPIWCSSEGGSTREAGGTVAESLEGRRRTRKRTMARSIE